MIPILWMRLVPHETRKMLEVLALTVFGFSWGVREGCDRSTAVIAPSQLRL